MSVETLNINMGDIVGDMMETDDLLLRRLSTYATLRPGDLTAVLGSSGDHTGLKFAPTLFQEYVREGRDRSCRQEDSSSVSDNKEECEGRDVVVRGQDIGDHPVEYVVRGIRRHEMAVIGLYVDPRILPGFTYRIRRLGSEKYLFQGRALTLQSVAPGYGKRLTFAGETHNFNDNYFWSDSEPLGFAFSLDAVQPGQGLTIYGSNGSGVVGEVRVERVDGHQEEVSCEVVKGDVIKRVRVTLMCSVTYFVQRHHAKMNLQLQNIERVTGDATVVKKRGTRDAVLDCIFNVQLTRVPGTCTLQNES